MRSYLKKERFANCCGMDTLTGWPYNGHPGDKNFDNLISDLEDIHVSCPMSNYIAILSGPQHKTVRDYLPKYGWRLVGTFYNYVHDNLLYLWVFESNPDRAPSNPLFRHDIFELNIGVPDRLRLRPGVDKSAMPPRNTVWIVPPALSKKGPDVVPDSREKGYNEIALREFEMYNGIQDNELYHKRVVKPEPKPEPKPDPYPHQVPPPALEARERFDPVPASPKGGRNRRHR